MPHSALALTAGTSTIVGARINKGTARELARFCASHDCTQSSVIREFVSQLAKSPHATNIVKLAKGDSPDAYAALLDLLGIDDPDTATTTAIQNAVKAILEENPPAGDAAGPEAADPNAAAAEPAPPANPLAASKLAPAQAAACVRKGLAPTAASWAALCKSTVRVAGKAPARAAAPTAPAAPRALTNQDVTGFSDAERRYMATHKLSAAEFTARKAKTVRRA